LDGRRRRSRHRTKPSHGLFGYFTIGHLRLPSTLEAALD
jgi:hypothetical protein